MGPMLHDPRQRAECNYQEDGGGQDPRRIDAAATEDGKVVIDSGPYCNSHLEKRKPYAARIPFLFGNIKRLSKWISLQHPEAAQRPKNAIDEQEAITQVTDRHFKLLG